MNTGYDSEIDFILRMAFGRAVPSTPIPVAVGRGERQRAFALHDRELPPRVMLLHYHPDELPRALRAFTVMRALRQVGFPVPETYYLGWGQASRDALMLIEHVQGRGEDGQPHAFFARVGLRFAHALAYLHYLEWEAFPDLAVLPFRYAFDMLATRVRLHGTSEMDDLLDWLLARVEGVEELPHTVLHGDYTLGHVLAEGTEVVAVLGWESALIADPRFDVGYASAVLGAYGIALSDQFLAAYEAAVGPIPNRTFWDVFSALRLLMRLTTVFDNAPVDRLEAIKAQALPAWNGLVKFAAQRAQIRL